MLESPGNKIVTECAPIIEEAPLTWNRIRHFHREPAVIAIWRKLLGPLLRWLTPFRRRFLLAGGAAYVAFKKPASALMGKHSRGDFLNLIIIAALMFAFVWLCYVAAKKFKALPRAIQRHPQITLHSVLWVLLVVLWTAPISNPLLGAVLVGCVSTLPFLLWRVGYMMFAAQRGTMTNTRFRDHLFYIFPVWRGSDTPYGKGWNHLFANEAQDEESLAKSQLAGLKVFFLAALCSAGSHILQGLGFGEDNAIHRTLGFSLNAPTMIKMYTNPASDPLWLRWVAVYLELFRHVLSLAISGHIIVGWLRFYGFNVFRNTYKPLLAETVVEFWNRFYYYFKELLVNFFFYPTFTRYFKSFPRLRIFAAVFVSAFVGNMYYHWLGKERVLISGDLRLMWETFQSRLFYCFLLTLGIWISMLREQKRNPNKFSRSFLKRALAVFVVWTFFSIINIWNQKGPGLFEARTKFFLGLFGLN